MDLQCQLHDLRAQHGELFVAPQAFVGDVLTELLHLDVQLIDLGFHSHTFHVPTIKLILLSADQYVSSLRKQMICFGVRDTTAHEVDDERRPRTTASYTDHSSQQHCSSIRHPTS